MHRSIDGASPSAKLTAMKAVQRRDSDDKRVNVEVGSPGMPGAHGKSAIPGKPARRQTTDCTRGLQSAYGQCTSPVFKITSNARVRPSLSDRAPSSSFPPFHGIENILLDIRRLSLDQAPNRPLYICAPAREYA